MNALLKQSLRQKRMMRHAIVACYLFFISGVTWGHASCLGGLNFNAGMVDELVDTTFIILNPSDKVATGVVNSANLYLPPTSYDPPLSGAPAALNVDHRVNSQAIWEHAVQTSILISSMANPLTNLGLAGNALVYSDTTIYDSNFVVGNSSVNTYKYVAITSNPGSGSPVRTFIDAVNGTNITGVPDSTCVAIIYRQDFTGNWLDFFQVNGQTDTVNTPNNSMPNPYLGFSTNSSGMAVFATASLPPTATQVQNFVTAQNIYAWFTYQSSYPVSDADTSRYLTIGSTAAALWTSLSTYLPPGPSIDGTISLDKTTTANLSNGAIGPLYSEGSTVTVSWTGVENYP